MRLEVTAEQCTNDFVGGSQLQSHENNVQQCSPRRLQRLDTTSARLFSSKLPGKRCTNTLSMLFPADSTVGANLCWQACKPVPNRMPLCWQACKQSNSLAAFTAQTKSPHLFFRLARPPRGPPPPGSPVIGQPPAVPPRPRPPSRALLFSTAGWCSVRPDGV